jgi:inner membrane protein
VATIVSHALVAVTAARLAYPADRGNRIAIWAAALAMLPDLDVVAFLLGIGYGDFFGHRGFSHSLAFALLAGVVVVATRFRERPQWTGRSWLLVGFFFLVTASHGLLDAMTNGGLGVAFFSPFENSRYFLPWTPLQVSPIGRGFFSGEGVEVLLNEALWIGLPCALLLVLARTLEFRRKIAASLRAPKPGG